MKRYESVAFSKELVIERNRIERELANEMRLEKKRYRHLYVGGDKGY